MKKPKTSKRTAGQRLRAAVCSTYRLRQTDGTEYELKATGWTNDGSLKFLRGDQVIAVFANSVVANFLVLP